jgi:hypothetical protein
MSEPRTPAWPAGRVPWGALWAAAVIAAVEAVVAGHRLELSPVLADEWHQAGLLARSPAAHADVLIVGGSQVKRGVGAPELARATGRSCFNLAANNGNLAGTYAVLRRALESGARPVAVVMDCSDAALLDGGLDVGELLRQNRRNWPELLTPAEALELAWAARDADLFAETGLAMALPSLRCRDEVRAATVRALTGKSDPLWDLVLGMRRNRAANAGSQIDPAHSVHQPPDAPLDDLPPPPWPPALPPGFRPRPDT